MPDIQTCFYLEIGWFKSGSIFEENSWDTFKMFWGIELFLTICEQNSKGFFWEIIIQLSWAWALFDEKKIP